MADEPTSALDKKTTAEIIAVLREISKKRTIVIVTHDTSLIKKSDTVFELDKGELVGEAEITKNTADLNIKKPKMSFASAFKFSTINLKRRPFKFLTFSLAIVIASAILLTSIGIKNTSESAFDDIYEVYGNSFLDISLTGSFINASGSADQDEDEPNVAVDQDISALFEVYEHDERVEYAVFTQSFKDVVIDFEGESYSAPFSGNVPVLNELIEGRIPNSDANEVVIPKSFAEFIGTENIMGKEIVLHSTIYRWEGNEPIAMPVSSTLTVVGVADNTTYFDSGHSVSIDDSFFVSKSSIDEMREMANIENDNVSFILRAKTPEDMIEIKDELNAQGIVPLGNFKLVEDIVRLNENTQDQSSSSSVVLIVISAVMVLVIVLFSALMRKREIAILKSCGYSKGKLFLLISTENIVICIASLVIFVATLPLFNLFLASAFEISISALLGIGTVALFCVISYALSSVVILAMNTKNALKSGDK